MKIQIDSQWRINAVGHIDLPLPAISVWGQMRDVAGFLSMDPLHKRVRFTGPPDGAAPGSPRGQTLLIPHRFLGIGPDRIGRILTWREGHGYAISDLSRRGPRTGFPHICAYNITPTGAERCRLEVSHRGRWTATWIPRPIVRLWLWWVLRATEGRIAAEMAALVVWRRRRQHRAARRAAPG